MAAPSVLKLGPNKGRHGCLIIPFSTGVCGAATSNRQTQIVDDFHQFDGHIACVTSTQSELITTMFDMNQNLMAVLDTNLYQPAFFSQEFATQLETLLAKFFGPD